MGHNGDMVLSIISIVRHRSRGQGSERATLSVRSLGRPSQDPATVQPSLNRNGCRASSLAEAVPRVRQANRIRRVAVVELCDTTGMPARHPGPVSLGRHTSATGPASPEYDSRTLIRPLSATANPAYHAELMTMGARNPSLSDRL